MSYEFWVKQLLDVMKHVADREYQVSRWLAPDAQAWEQPGELMNELFDDCTFELFIDLYSDRMEQSQLLACNNFKDRADHWCHVTQDYSELKLIIDSPDWIRVREAAADFIRSFTPAPEQPA